MQRVQLDFVDVPAARSFVADNKQPLVDALDDNF
jgi:hypothetical protein